MNPPNREDEFQFDPIDSETTDTSAGRQNNIYPDLSVRLQTQKNTLKDNAGAQPPFGGIAAQQWNDWQWHVRNRITSAPELEKCISLSPEERTAIDFSQGVSRFSLTPYWVSLMDPQDTACPIRRQSIPLSEEFKASVHESYDPGNDGIKIADGCLTHIYPDRVMLSIHSQCIVYCRFCSNKKIPSDKNIIPGNASIPGIQEFPAISNRDWQEITDYLTQHPGIREVIVSGGEPLLLRDELLHKTFARLKSIPTIKTLRLETRIVSLLPQRITPEFVQILKQFQPLYIVMHINHPKEITRDFTAACARMTDSGIPLVSQTVLLKDINDNSQNLYNLFLTLFKLRIRPYRLVQCLPSGGADHFRTDISSGLKLINFLRGRMSGLSLPEYVVETVGGKIPLHHESILSRNKKRVLLKNYEGKIFVYPEKNFAN